MYDRFTDRARKVMQLSNLEALHRNHKHLGTEHLLLGLVKEGSGLAATALIAVGVDAKKMEVELLKIAPNGTIPLTTDKVPPSPDAKKAMVHAFEEVKLLKSGFVDTEHILLGLLQLGESKASHLLNSLGVSPQKVITQIKLMLSGAAIPPINDPEDDDMSDDYDMRATVKRINPQRILKQIVLHPDEESIAPPMPNGAESSGSSPKPPPMPMTPAPSPMAQSPMAPSPMSPQPAPAAYSPPVSAPESSSGYMKALSNDVPRPAGPIVVDQAVRQALQLCWSNLPTERRNAAILSAEFRLLVERALRDFEEDLRAFSE